MNPTDLKRMFPNASADVLARNGGIIIGGGQPNKCHGSPNRSQKPAIRMPKQVKKDENTTRSQLSNPISQYHQASALGAASEGKKEGLQRTRVSFRLLRVKPLDPDNAAGSVKDLLDGLRHAALLQGDEPWRIILETEQEKVSHYYEQKTVITIEYPEPL